MPTQVALLILNLAYLTVLKTDSELMDDDWNFIIYEFQMNYTADSIRHGYYEQKKQKEQKASDDLLRKLGYSDTDILKNK